jgi:hypothetical protein
MSLNCRFKKDKRGTKNSSGKIRFFCLQVGPVSKADVVSLQGYKTGAAAK